MLNKTISIIFFLVIVASCTKDFKEINTNPNASASLPVDYILGEVQLQMAGANTDNKSWRGNFGYAACIVQHMSSVDVGFYGGSFYTSPTNNFAAYFDDAYPNAVKNIVNLVELTKDVAKDVNVLSMARIIKVMEFSRLTDLYGDVPYFDAGKGYSQVNFTPKYDLQKDIYLDMLKELEEAGAALNGGAYIPVKADFMYSGDVAKWKRAANTLMLRLAMRMQKVDGDAAKLWAAKAINGGLISGSSENITINFDGSGPQISNNPNSWVLGPAGRNQTSVSNGSLWAKTLIDMMKARQDPRLPVIAVLKNGNNTVSNQVGLPNGTNTNILATLTPSNVDLYSRPAPNMYRNNNGWIYMTYAEAKLLQAEAIERGYVTGSATAAFIEGQTASINQVSVYGTTPSGGELATYAAANVYPAAGTMDAKMNAIHTELYLVNAVTLNHIEAWSNWRRSGYPVLVPINPVGNETNGVIPRRLKYSVNEFGVNPNVTEAVTRQGADLYTTRIWWDKQ